MARPHRCDNPGVVYHVITRGVGRRTLCDTVGEFRYLLSRILYAVRRGELELLAFCLMRNHVHLIVRSVGKTSIALRRILSQHALRFNLKRDRAGPLFERRFIAKPILSDLYGGAAIGYTHENPVEAGLVDRPEDYLWSSARYLARPRPPVWLDGSYAHELGISGPEVGSGASAEVRAARRRLVEARMDGDGWGGEVEDPLDFLAAANVRDLATWMIERAELADGYASMPPVTTAVELEQAIAPREAGDPAATVRLGRGWPHPLWDQLRIGLARDLGRETLRSIAARVGCSEFRARSAHARHAQMLGADEEYADLAAGIAKAAVGRLAPGA